MKHDDWDDELRSAWQQQQDDLRYDEPENPTSSARPQLCGVVAAGFPSPAEGYAGRPLDLNELLVQRPAATFFVRACGDSMVGAAIQDGDILVVDRSLEPRQGTIVIACVNGEFTVKFLQRQPNGQVCLVAANPRYAPILLNDSQEVEIFGVVTATIHRFGQGTHSR